MEATITAALPVRGAEQDKTSTNGEDAWLAQRRGGITSTEILKWRIPSGRRQVLAAKQGKDSYIGNMTAVRHGNNREPIIAAWIQERFGLEPSNHVYSHAENARYLASPDGITVDPFTGELVAGPGSSVAEVKTTSRDLHPGILDENRMLVAVDAKSHFAKLYYFDQMQWSMYVMNAERCLFVWEVHTGRDDGNGGYIVEAEPQWCWVPRSEERIAILRGRADEALETIDRNAASAGIPPVVEGDLDSAILVTEYLEALERESTAKKAKEAAWKKLQARYLVDEQADDSLDLGFARVTISTYEAKPKVSTDLAAARAEEPDLASKWDAVVARHTTSTTPAPTRGLTITRKASE